MADISNADDLSDRLSRELSAGRLDLTRAPQMPNLQLPDSSPEALHRSIRLIRQIMDVREGNVGSILDKHLTLRDLVNAGVVSLTVGGETLVGGLAGTAVSGGGGVINVTVGGGGGGTTSSDPRPEYVTPPTITGLTAFAAFKNILLEWDTEPINFANFAYVEVWRAAEDNLAVAAMIGTSTGSFYTDMPGVQGLTYYYWVRSITTSATPGAYNAVSGVSAALAVDVGLLLDTLEDQITESQLYGALNSRIDLIDAPSSVPGSVAARLLAEADTRTAAIGVETYNRGLAIAALSSVKSRTFYSASAPVSDASYTLQTNDTWVDTDDTNKVYRYNGSAWVAASDTRIGDTVADISAEAVIRETADLAEAAVRESVYAGFGGTAGTDYKVFNQAGTPTGTTIGDVWTWKTTSAETFKRWNGATWVDSVSNKRAAVYRGEYANSGALPATGNVIGDLARRADTNAVVVWDGSGWVAKSTTPAPVTAFIEQEARVRADAVSAEAARTDALESTVNTPSTGLVARATALESVTTNVTSGNTALATRASALESTVNTPSTGLVARAVALESVTTNVTSGNTALATRASALETTVNTPSTGLVARATALESVTTNVTSGNTALATRASSLETTVNTPSTGLVARAVALESVTTNVTSGNAALATRASALESTVNTAGTGLLARVSTVESVTTDANSGNAALSSRVTTLSSSVAARALGKPLTEWVLNGQSIVTLSDGKVGDKALRLIGLSNGFPNQGNLVPIDRTKKYRVRFWARPVAAAGVLYFCLRQFLDAAGVTPAATNGGRSPYKPSITRAGHNSLYGGTDQWGEYSYIWEAADWQSGTTHVQPEFLDNFSVQSGYWEIQDFSFTDATVDAELSSAIQVAASTTAALDGSVHSLYTVRTEVSGAGGTVIGGFGLAGTSTTAEGASIDFGVVANRFYVAAPASAAGVGTIRPFAVHTTSWSDNGVVRDAGVYMDAAFIKNLTAVYATISSLVADQITAASISVSKLTAGTLSVGAYIQSADYTSGPSGIGYKLTRDAIELPATSIRGQLTATQINTSGLTIGYGALTGTPTSLSAINSTEGAKLTGIASNATRNVVTYSGTPPGSPVDGDLWVDTSASFAVFKLRSSGAWVTGANALTAYNALSGTPVALADINTTESTKLAGIAAGATVGAPVGTLVGSTAAATVESNAAAGNTAATATATFRTAGAPTNSPTSVAVAYAQTTDGNVVATVSYSYTQGARPADALLVRYRETGGTVLSSDPCVATAPSTGALTLVVKPGAVYRFGVSASRLAADGYYEGSIVETANATASAANFTGNLNGTVASTVVTNASNGDTAATNTATFRTNSAPTNNPASVTATFSQTADGNVVATISYTYTQGARQADALVVYYKEGGGTITTASPGIATKPVTGTITIVVKPSTLYRFGVAAARVAAGGYYEGSIVATAADQTSSAANFTGNLDGTAASTVVTKVAGIEAGATVGAGWTTNLTGRPGELTDGRITTAIDSNGIMISKAKPGLVAAPTTSGLYLGSDFLGYYNATASAWKTFMDNAGNFYLGGTGGSLQWNGTALSIYGGGNFTGSVSVNSATWSTGDGFWTGIDSSLPKLFVGTRGGSRLEFNGSSISMYVTSSSIIYLGFSPSFASVSSYAYLFHPTTPTTSDVKFKTDGTVYTVANGTETYNKNYYNPTTAGIGSTGGSGSGIWVRATKTSGTTPNRGAALGVWWKLDADRYWGLSYAVTGSISCELSVQLATDSTGTNVVSTGTLFITAEHDT